MVRLEISVEMEVDLSTKALEEMDAIVDDFEEKHSGDCTDTGFGMGAREYSLLFDAVLPKEATELLHAQLSTFGTVELTWDTDIEDIGA
jgi:hypothetical protein